jgi:prepilin-type N-terminal cleavage/methylation domain-containing protein
MQTMSPEKGFTLIELMLSIGVLTVGVLGTAAVLATGMQNLSSSPADVIVTQKANEAIEAVFSARDSHKLTWSQIRNVRGVTGSDGGVFLDGPTKLTLPGPDGIVNTLDDPPTIETIDLPGHDQILGTADDQIITLTNFTRQIAIADVANEDGNLRMVTVTITYQNGPTTRTYKLVSFISSYS